jgi:hypothetical protein
MLRVLRGIPKSLVVAPAGLAVGIVMLAGCDVDLFGTDARPVVGGYKLLVWESGNYTLITDERNGCGVLNGNIERIAWSDSVILAEQTTCGGRNARSGWMVVDVKKHTIEGPIDPETIPKRADVAALKPIPPAEAWQKLPWR